MDKQKRLNRIRARLKLQGDIRLRELKQRYYELSLSIKFPVELKELKRQLGESEISYSRFCIETDKLLMQDPNYVELKKLEAEILILDPTFLESIRSMTERHVIKVLTNRFDELKDRIVDEPITADMPAEKRLEIISGRFNALSDRVLVTEAGIKGEDKT